MRQINVLDDQTRVLPCGLILRVSARFHIGGPRRTELWIADPALTIPARMTLGFAVLYPRVCGKCARDEKDRKTSDSRRVIGSLSLTVVVDGAVVNEHKVCSVTAD